MFELAISHRTLLGANSVVMTVECRRPRRLAASKHGRAPNYSLRAKKIVTIYLLGVGVGVAVGAVAGVGLGSGAGGVAGGVAVQDL